MENIQFVTIPANDWNRINSKLDFIATELLAIKEKNSKEFLTPKEVCQKLKCSRNTYQNYVDSGKLKPLEVKRGIYKKILFRNADIDYFLQNNKAL